MKWKLQGNGKFCLNFKEYQPMNIYVIIQIIRYKEYDVIQDVE